MKYFRKTLIAFMTAVLGFSGTACTPGNTNNYITSNGADKKLPDDDGYTGSGGTGDGGGGQGIYCSEKALNPKFRSKLFVRDIFELLYNAKAETIDFSQSASLSANVSEEAIILLVSQLKKFFGPAIVNLEFGNVQFWKNFASKISFIDEDATLHVSQDANSPIALPAGCKIMQIAFWDDSLKTTSEGTLYVDGAQWKQLDELNKVALLAHEYFFKEARKSSYKNSDFIRGRIGQLFSANGSSALFSKWVPSKELSTSEVLPLNKTGFKYCVGTSEQDPSAKSVLYQYRGSDGQDYFVIPFLNSNIISKSSLQKSEFNISSADASLLDIMYLNDTVALVPGNLRVQDSPYLDFELAHAGLQGLGQQQASAELDLSVANGGVIWRGYFDLGSGLPARISVQIPVINVSKSEEDIRKKSKEQITGIIISAIRASLDRVADDWEISRRDSVLEDSAILALKKDVSDLIGEGQRREEFPKWLAALKKIEDKYLQSNPGRKNSAARRLLSFSDISVLSHVLPTLLLRHEAGILEAADYSKIEGMGPTSDSSIASQRSVMMVEAGSDKIQFSLHCQDYNSTYASYVAGINRYVRDDRWVDPKFDVRNLKPLDVRTQREYPDVLKHLSEQAKDYYMRIGPCSEMDYNVYERSCIGRTRFFEALASKGRGDIQVTGCSEDDLSFAGSVRSNMDSADDYIARHSCLNLRIGTQQYFKVYTLLDDDKNVTESHIISMAPPGAEE